MELLEDRLRTAQKLVQGGQWTDALGVLNRVAPEEANSTDYKIFRARLLMRIGRDSDALSDIEEADGGQASARLLSLRAEVEEKLGRVEDAIKTLTRALDQDQNASLLARRAVLFQGRGQFDEARDDLATAIRLRPGEGELYRLLSSQHKFEKNDPLLEQLRHYAGRAPVDSPNYMGFLFAEAKALDDLAEFDLAFAKLGEANGAMRKQYPYKISTRLNTVRNYKKSFETFDAKAHQSTGALDYAPIFITGMPRSGTTLVEQIISCHAHVQAGGETARFHPHMIDTIGNPALGKVVLSPQRVSLLGQRYRAEMLKHLHIAKRHTDKSLQSALYAGPIHAALGKAKIIVVTRNPNATALSLFKHVFRPGKQLYSYNLDDIRIYQKSFDEMVQFWQDRLPGLILTVAYEDVVGQPEATIRRMLDFVDLDWDPACLRPEQNSRDVRTLSAIAARRPISLGARDHWRNYAHLMDAQ